MLITANQIKVGLEISFPSATRHEDRELGDRSEAHSDKTRTTRTITTHLRVTHLPTASHN